MDINSIELLEFETIRNECASYCLSPEGRSRIAEQQFESEADRLDLLLSRVCDFRTILTRADGFPLHGFPDLSFIFQLEKEGRILEGQQLAALGIFIRNGDRLRDFITTWHQSITQLSGTLMEPVHGLPQLKAVTKIIFAELDENGDIREDHPALRKIRGNMRRIHGDLTSASSEVMRKNPQYWQMEGPVLREGRTVLPLKADYRGKVKGIIHETSSSGNTLYIEPFDMVDMNNEKAVQESAYRNAMHAIVREISNAVRGYFHDIVSFVGTVGYIDTIYARARYGYIHDCARARTTESDILLIAARHPHLGASAVPIQLGINRESRVMIITGPNAGGKTVTLKTVGLLALMNQFGLEIPAAEGSELPVFDDIYADIGDDQSISASLSTFSGHMKRIASVMRYSTEKSLVLLDELGAGTDPSEGSALAMSILDEFLSLGSTVIVTTHHSVIKQFAYTREGVVNASLDFDTDQLKPTYRVIEGLPGESHALDIAVKSGLSEKVARKAEKFVRERRSDISAAIEEIEKRKRELMNAEHGIARKEAELRELRRSVDLETLSLKQKERELSERELRDTNRFIRESRKELENLVRELKEKELTRARIKKMKQFTGDLEKSAAAEERRVEDLHRDTVPASEYTPSPGDKVTVSGKEGEVLREEKDGRYLVRVGSMKVILTAEELKPGRRDKEKREHTVTYSSPVGGGHAAYELDLRGMRLEAALLQLEKQIDGAVLSGMDSFGVIHGSGEGILRRGVHDFLKQCPVVENFEFSHPLEGGFGKTIVRLKQY